MYYYNKKSSRKIIHSMFCFHVANTDLDDIGWFESLNEAYEHGYRLCRKCSPIATHYRKELDSIISFSQINGVAVYLHDKFIGVTSPSSKWKIVPCSYGQSIELYHKNTFKTEQDDYSAVPGYHYQSVIKESIIDYLDYVVQHDAFRRFNPVKPPKNKTTPAVKPAPRKGTKRYQKAQKHAKRVARSQSIKNVLSIIDSLHQQSAVTM